MKKGCKIALAGGLAVAVGAVACWKWMFRMPLKEFTRCALYMAVMDDEICRNELEGNRIGDEVITFPPKEESLQYRYHLFLQMNRACSLLRTNRTTGISPRWEKFRCSSLPTARTVWT